MAVSGREEAQFRVRPWEVAWPLALFFESQDQDDPGLEKWVPVTLGQKSHKMKNDPC